MKKTYKVLLLCVFTIIIAFIALNHIKNQYMSNSSNISSYPTMIHKSNGNTKIMAKVDGIEVSESELIGSEIMMHYNLKQREFEFRQARLRNYITQHYLSSEAKKLGIEVSDYIRNHIVKEKNINPSEQEIKDFAKSQNLPPIEQMKQNEQAWAQINNFLRMRKEFDLVQIEVNKWTKNHKVEYYFDRPSVPLDISIQGSPVWGSSSAKVTIVEFGDLECPFCAKVVPVIKKLKEIYGDKIKIVFKHMPLQQHPNSLKAAMIGTCLADQSDIKFWNFYELTLAKVDKLSDSVLRENAKQAKANLTELDKCLEKPTTKAQIMQDGELANRLGLESTPVFFINGEMISGVAPVEAFQEAIDYYLEEK